MTTCFFRMLAPFGGVLLTHLLSAQTPDSIIAPVATDTLRIVGATPADSLGVADSLPRFFADDYPNPRKAVLFGLVVPGAGQIYNRKWWKVPIVYGVVGGVGWWEIQKIKEYRLFRDNYRWLVDRDSATVVTDPRLQRLDATTMRANRDIARQNVEYTSIVLGLAVLLSVADAFVDAHMATFDVSDDLSLRFCPKVQSVPSLGPTFGVGVTFQLRPRTRVYESHP
jgi:Family of unknown function (DUF5683)